MPRYCFLKQFLNYPTQKIDYVVHTNQLKTKGLKITNKCFQGNERCESYYSTTETV